jgi:hypothetical protein
LIEKSKKSKMNKQERNEYYQAKNAPIFAAYQEQIESVRNECAAALALWMELQLKPATSDLEKLFMRDTRREYDDLDFQLEQLCARQYGALMHEAIKPEQDFIEYMRLYYCHRDELFEEFQEKMIKANLY